METAMSVDTGLEQQEIVTDPRGADYSIRNPTHNDIPSLPDEAKEGICDDVIKDIPGIIGHGATDRPDTIATLACQYVRYRRTRVRNCRTIAIKSTAKIQDINESAVYGHVDSLPIDLDEEFTSHLNQIYQRYHRGLPEVVRECDREIDRLIKILETIAEINTAPEISPADLTLHEIYMDQPSERSRVLTGGPETIGLPDTDEEDWEASVSNIDVDLDNFDPEKGNENDPLYDLDRARIKPRDAASYNTEFSKVLREIFQVVQSKMTLYGKQKPDPLITPDSKDNAAVCGKIAYPSSIGTPSDYFARLKMVYRVNGASEVSIKINTCDKSNYIQGPELVAPIEKLSEPGICVLIGKTIDIINET
jgi:hypothetical protein